jgi:hypothetical protein
MVRGFDENVRREMANHISRTDPTGKRGQPRRSRRDGVTEAMEIKGDGCRRRIGPDAVEKGIGKSAGIRINPDIHTYECADENP